MDVYDSTSVNQITENDLGNERSDVAAQQLVDGNTSFLGRFIILQNDNFLWDL